MKYPEVSIHNIADLISKLEAHNPAREKLWFRGHANKDWALEPSIARGREKPVVDEFLYYKRFKQEAARVIADIPVDEWGWMFLMQHYGVHTRLLDFSENPLIALYFAVNELPESDGALYILEPTKWNAEQGRDSLSASDLPSCGIDEEMTGYLMSNVVKQIETQESNPPIAAIGSRNSARIFAQEGTFVVTHLDLKMTVDNDQCKSVWRYIIPRGAKHIIQEHLALLSISDYSVFPELKTLAKKIMS
jgi:hypothetical protein